MSSSDPVSETLDQRSNGVAQRVGSLAGTVAPKLARHAESGNLAAASGVVSLVRAGRTFLRGDRKRGALQALAGLFWVGVALAQRRSGGDGGGPGRSRTDVSEVADTSPDVEDAVEPGGRDADHATGGDVVDTTDADIDEADTAPEIDESAEVASDVDEGDVDQRDVTGGTDVGDAAESGDADETESGADEDETESEAGEDETDSAAAADAGESDERVETTSGE
ncbi:MULTISPECIES: hypothetical protein [Halorussus]|uniref:hypothetical protein n=1 Tax=Halorussus TaxID=1070314 RepID=UPI000E20D2B6|nr:MULTISPECIES: hypothetical protein [Halorussus]NHN58167.1 hypothetical protein [Halorussus sp. JP-T4]